ncbi:MAG: hypothetical protein IJ583_07495, partial [Firmicutes bacterium]|nr:hypothetical protein [Bacillota bacterium]
MGNPTISNFSSMGIGNAFFNFQSSMPRYIKPIPPHGMLKATLPAQWSENSQELPVQQVKAARSASEQQAVSEIYTEPEPQKREIHLSAAASLPLKKRKGNKKSRQVFKPSDFTANSLFDDDLEKIVVKYGSEIEDIYNLAPGQKWMFEKANKVSSDFFLQLMFKAVISIKPSELRQKIEEVCLKRDNLRSAYVYRDMSQPFRVVLKNRALELRCEELSYQSEDELDARIKSIMEADRRRGFDLEKDSLLRIAIYKTGKDDTYAILVSQPHINTDGISMMLLIKDIFMDYALELSGIDMELETRSYREYAKWLESKDTEKELLYWKELLADAPIYTGISRIANSSFGQPQISELSRFFSDDVQDALKKKQSEFHATQNNLMQAAWGIMLMKLYGINDAVFGAITSGRDADVAGSSMIAGGFI